MNSPSFTFQVEVPRQVRWTRPEGLRTFSREDFYAFLWEEFPGEITGIHEGTLLTEEAFEAGLETESWTVDSAEAPRERDWIDSQDTTSATLYFVDQISASRARELIRS